MQQPNSTYVDYGKLACKLEQKLDKWNRAVLSKDSVKMSYADKELVVCVNEIASIFGVVGGAVALANYEENSFQLIRRYDLVDQGELLFPYIESLRTSLLDHVKNCTDYSTWMHGLFAVQRDDQLLIADNKLGAEYASMKLPEYYRHFDGNSDEETSNILIVPHEKILRTIQRWVDILELASINPRGLMAFPNQATIDFNNGRFSHNDSASFLDCIKSAFVNTSPTFMGAQEYFPEKQFFYDESSSKNLILARKLIEGLTIASIRSTLGIDRNHKELLNQDGPSNTPLLSMLTSLHNTSLFPIIPYLFLNLLDHRNLSHCVLPLMRTTEFPLTITSDNSEGNVLNPCYMFMLCTVAEEHTQETDEDMQNHKLRLFSLSMLIRLAAEPMVDRKFYGGIQRRSIHNEATRSTFSHFFRRITHEIGPLQERLLGTWLVPFQDIKSSVCADTSNADTLRIVTVPQAYKMVANRFALWTSKGWFERMEIMNDMTFLAVLGILVRSAAESHTVTYFAKQIESDQLSDISYAHTWDSAMEAVTQKYINQIIINNPESIGNIIWRPGSSVEDIEVATNFCRLFVAVTSNSLKNCNDGKIATNLSFDADKLLLEFIQTNPAKETEKVKEDGTMGVVHFLIDLLQGKSSSVRFEFDQATESWVTGFVIPTPFLIADGRATK